MTTSSAARPRFHGDGATLFGIHLKNLLLTIVTLGIYSFWAKADVRQYLYSNTSLGGDRFTYHGTGRELFNGASKAFGLLILIGIASSVMSGLIHPVAGAIVLYAGSGLLLFPVALIGSRRYRLSRTSWRGIRFSFKGDYGDFFAMYVVGALLTVISLGLYYPYFHANIRRYVVKESRFGNRHFDFDGQGSDLMGRHVLLYLLLPLTLGIYWFWHAAYRQRYYWEHTRFGTTRFRSTMTGGDLLGVTFVNGLLMIVTLGIAYPWVQARMMEFQCERLILSSLTAFDEAKQEFQASSTFGEGVADALDMEMAGADFFGL